MQRVVLGVAGGIAAYKAVELLRQLTDLAGCRGVRRFTALVSTDNMRMRRMLARMFTDVELVGREAGTLSYEIPVQRPLEPCA